MAVIEGYVYGFVHETIYVPGDALQTSKLLQDNLSLFKSGIASWGLIIILDVLVAMGIYGIYRDTQQKLAALTSLFRIIYALFLGFVLLRLCMPLIDDSEVANSLVYFDAFETIWSYGLVVFGIHLLLFAVVGLKSKITPIPGSILLFLGGMSYIVVHGSKSFIQSSNFLAPVIENVLTVPMAVSELAFAAWIIFKCFRLKKPQII